MASSELSARLWRARVRAWLRAAWTPWRPAAGAADPNAPPNTAGRWGGMAAKWLVPSASLLFAVIGYVAQSSQESLLGLQADTTEVQKYSSSAIGFLLQLLNVLIELSNALLAVRLPSLHGHGKLLIGLTLIVLLLGAASATVAGRGRLRPLMTGVMAILLVAVVLGKYVTLDVPLMRLDNLVLDLGQVQATSSGVAARPTGLAERSPSQDDLWADLVCSRVGPATEQDRSNQNLVYNCPKTRGAAVGDLSGEFTAHLWFAALIALLALEILKREAVFGAHLLAWAAILYLLTVPFAYGKLMMSTYFDLGVITFTHGIPGEPPPPKGQTLPDSATALILSRGPSGVNILETVSDTCAKADETYQGIRLASFAPAEVRAIRQIYRQDIIVWAVLNAHGCATAAQGPAG